MSRKRFFEIYDILNIKDRHSRYLQAESLYTEEFEQNHFSDERIFVAALQLRKQETDYYVGNLNQNPRTNR